jgi:hypothetical protein
MKRRKEISSWSQGSSTKRNKAAAPTQVKATTRRVGKDLAIIYMTKHTDDVADRLPLEITDEMVEAGVFEAREHTLGESLEELVRKILGAAISGIDV